MKAAGRRGSAGPGLLGGGVEGETSEELAYLVLKHHGCAVDMDCPNGTAPSSTSGCHSGSSGTTILGEATTKRNLQTLIWAPKPASGDFHWVPLSLRGHVLPAMTAPPFKKGEDPRKRHKSNKMNLPSTFVPLKKALWARPKPQTVLLQFFQLSFRPGHLWPNKFRKTWVRTMDLPLPCNLKKVTSILVSIHELL